MRYFVIYKDGVPFSTIRSIPDREYAGAVEVTQAEFEAVYAVMQAKREEILKTHSNKMLNR